MKKWRQLRLSAKSVPALDERSAPILLLFSLVTHADRTSGHRLINRRRYTRKENGFSCSSKAAINADVVSVNVMQNVVTRSAMGPSRDCLCTLNRCYLSVHRRMSLYTPVALFQFRASKKFQHTVPIVLNGCCMASTVVHPWLSAVSEVTARSCCSCDLRVQKSAIRSLCVMRLFRYSLYQLFTKFSRIKTCYFLYLYSHNWTYFCS